MISKTPTAQLDLFSLVDNPINNSEITTRYSNAIGGIDIIPRFNRGFNPQIPIKEAPHILEIKKRYYVNNIELYCTIKPAQLRKKINGIETTVLAYPGDREELIEKVLFLMASNGRLIKKEIPGVAPRYGIEFSLYEIYQHLKSINKSKPYEDIKEALIVLRDSVVTISHHSEGQSVEITNNIFVDSLLETSGKGRGRERCFITFSDYVIEQITNLNYRQYAFDSINGHKKTVTMFIHSFLCWNWINATEGATFLLDPVLIMEGYGKIDKSIAKTRRDVRAAIQDLVDEGYLACLPRLKNGKYTLTCTKKLAREIFRANKKKKGLVQIQTQLTSGELNSIPDNRMFFMNN